MLYEAAAEPIAPPSTSGDRSTIVGTLRRHRWGLAMTAALAAIFSQVGVPLDATALLFFAVAVIAVDTLATRGTRETAVIVGHWAPLIGILIAYGLTNGIAERVGMPLQVEALINADKAMFGGTIPTIWLQERLVGAEVAPWEVILTLVYVSHFVICPALLLWLYIRDLGRWRAFAVRFLTLNAIGLATYVLVPAAPPWWAAEHGRIDEVQRVLGRGWSVLGLDTAGGIMVAGQESVNEVAALPSLHAGYACLFSMFLWRAARRSQAFLALYPLAMGFTLVYGGEHYVIDLVLGAAYAAGVLRLWNVIDARRNESFPRHEHALVPNR